LNLSPTITHYTIHESSMERVLIEVLCDVADIPCVIFRML